MPATESKVMFALEGSDRPMTVSDLCKALGDGRANIIRKHLTRLNRKGRLWRGWGREYGWGGPHCAWWWPRRRAEEAGLGQLYSPTIRI